MPLDPGLKIPNEQDMKISAEKFKSTNEIIMQTLIDWKIVKDDLLGNKQVELIDIEFMICYPIEPMKRMSDLLRNIGRLDIHDPGYSNPNNCDDNGGDSNDPFGVDLN